MFCTNCGKTANGNFCGYCGTKIENTSPVEIQVPTASVDVVDPVEPTIIPPVNLRYINPPETISEKTGIGGWLRTFTVFMFIQAPCAIFMFIVSIAAFVELAILNHAALSTSIYMILILVFLCFLEIYGFVASILIIGRNKIGVQHAAIFTYFALVISGLRFVYLMISNDPLAGVSLIPVVTCIAWACYFNSNQKNEDIKNFK
jgi:hypothetical protein